MSASLRLSTLTLLLLWKVLLVLTMAWQHTSTASVARSRQEADDLCQPLALNTSGSSRSSGWTDDTPLLRDRSLDGVDERLDEAGDGGDEGATRDERMDTAEAGSEKEGSTGESGADGGLVCCAEEVTAASSALAVDDRRLTAVAPL